ncbi:MAG: T9SS type A sorting domain-containing protein [Ignavibacteriaceae bacterium]|nr:T9SS type A sorting domain-containing protein [Ignavibacteriaceae bacterium]
MKNLVVIVTISLHISLLAQVTDTLWTKTIGGGSGQSVQQTADGGYIVAGVTDPTGILIKTDSIGDTIWKKIIGPSSIVYSVQETIDGGFVLTGHINYDLMILKTDENGNVLWTKLYDNNGQDIGSALQQTADGGFIITGETSTIGNGFDLWLLKTDSLGDTIWTKIYGDTGYDWGYSVEQTLDGGYIVTGRTGTNAGDTDLWLIKTDPSGNVTWSKTFGGASNDAGYSVKQTDNGGYIITGEADGSYIYGHFIWLLKTDEFGDTLWTKKYGAGESRGYSVLQTEDKGFIVACDYTTYSNNAAILRTDSLGNLQWLIVLDNGGNDKAFSINRTNDEGYIVTGYTNLPQILSQIWLIKLGPELVLDLLYPNGGEYWINGTTEAIAWSGENLDDVKIELSIDNGASWSAIVDSTPSTGLYVWTVNCPAYSSECIVRISDLSFPDYYDESDSVFTIDIAQQNIAVLIPNGGENWIIGTNEPIAWTSENVSDVKIELSIDNGISWNTIVDSTASNGLYIWTVNCSAYSSECLVRISDLSFPDYYDESDSVFTIDLPQSVELLDDKGIPEEFTLFQNFPNPFNPTTTIQFGVPTSCFVELKLYDVLGNEINTLISEFKEPGYYNYNLNAEELSSGIYFYTINAGVFAKTKKMLLLK